MKANFSIMKLELHDAMMSRLFMATRQFTRLARDLGRYHSSEDDYSVSQRAPAFESWQVETEELETLFAECMALSREVILPAGKAWKRSQAAVKANATRKARKAKA